MVNILVSINIILIVLLVFQYKAYLYTKFMLNRTNEINNRMMVISEELSAFKDIEVLYRKLLDETISLIEGAESGSILIYNKEKDYMEYKACVGHDEEALRRVHFKKEELFLFDTTRLKAPDIVKNPMSFNKEKMDKHNFDDMMKSNSLSIKVCLSSPLYINGEFFGTITVDNKSNEEAFDKNDIKLISYISRGLEIAIKNAILVNELGETLRTDELTGLYNRRYFEEFMDSKYTNKLIDKESFSVIMIDLDNFKIVNDTYGHRTGDEVLKYFANVLKRNIREEDLVVRYAGDEFVVYLNNTNKKGALEIVAGIRESLGKYPGENIKIDFSAGICEYTKKTNLDRLITKADDNMYKEKRQKKSMENNELNLA